MTEIKRANATVGMKVIPVGFSLKTPKIYLKAFKSNFWTDISIECNRDDGSYDIPKSERIAWQVAWCVAKTANPKIDDLNGWVKQFGNMSGLTVMNSMWKDLHE